MKIEIWSDYACPYCYIGKRYLEEALARFEHAQEVEIVYRAFELDPSAGRSVTTTTLGRIENKYGKTAAQAQQMIDHIISMGASAGLDMRYGTVRYTNTFDAHRLTHFAATKGISAAVTEGLFRAYFTDNLALAEREVLIKVAVEAGLDHSEVAAMLASDEFSTDARADESRAREMGIRSVPHMVIDGEQQFAGAQPAEHVLRVLQDLWAESRGSDESRPTDTPSCGMDGCIPTRN